MPARVDRAGLPARPHLKLETALWKEGLELVAGIDEAGRGAWAGPVAAAAVVLPRRPRWLRRRLVEVRDSKRLSPRTRERLCELISTVALSVGVGCAAPAEVDAHGLMAATRAAMRRAVDALDAPPQHLLVDAVNLCPELILPQESMYFGDSISLSIAAASIVAKVHRDRLMRALGRNYPGYGFERHKGYGTCAHRAAVTRLHPTPEHRCSVRPIAALLRAKSNTA